MEQLLQNIMSYDCIVILHRLYFDGKIKKGGLDLIVDYLVNHHKRVLLFEFPLSYGQSTQVRISCLFGEHVTTLLSFQLPNFSSTFNWIFEYIFTCIYVVFFVGRTKLLITADPLTTLAGVTLRKLHLAKNLYYHSVDYSTDRFENKVQNYIYTKLLVFGLKHADVVGFVTLKALERLKVFKVKSSVFIPNSPDFSVLEPYRKNPDSRDTNALVVTVSDVSHKYLIHALLEMLQRVRLKFPQTTLRIIGNTTVSDPYYSKLQQFISENNLKDAVTFYGHVTREESYKILGDSGIGLAFYDGMFSHVIYGDALKIREYCAVGLPVVADNHTYTAVDMAENECGFCVENIKDAQQHIEILLEDKNAYRTFCEKSLVWAAKNDKKKILDRLFSENIRLD